MFWIGWQVWWLWVFAFGQTPDLAANHPVYFLPTPAGMCSFQVLPDKRMPRERSWIVRRMAGETTIMCRLPTRPVFKLRTCDIDGDGRLDLIAGVVKTISNIPYRRIYVYSMEGNRLLPLWLGTRLSYHLLDFDLRHIGRKTLLLANERRGKKSFRGLYQWREWGFRSLQMKEEVSSL